MASLLEAQINQYTIEIKEKEAEIKDLRLQRRQLKDADEKQEKRLEDDIQALEGRLEERVKLRSKLQDKLPGAFGRHQHPH
jgi:hypothetical protein